MHYPNHYPGQGGRGPGEDVKGGFATCAAAMVSIVISPPFHEFTAPYVWELSRRSYGPEMVNFIMVCWMILTWPLTFFAARAAIIAGLTVAGVYIAYRLI